MDLAVLSDIHGNYAAFARCIEYALARKVRVFLFLGDYLGEFPYPQKTMEMIYALKKQYPCYFIRGNKEDYWLDRKYNPNCEWKDGNHTVGALQYCYKHLSQKDLDFFEQLPISREIQLENACAILACHGSPNRNNEKMLPNHEKTRQIMDAYGFRYILCGHTHEQGMIRHGDRLALNPGSVGISLHCGGKAQFMLLHQEGPEWAHEFISLDYDKEQIMKEMQESGLEDAAPYWIQVTKHLMRTGEVSNATVLKRAIQLCKEETGECIWYRIPGVYWQKAISELLT